MTETRLGKITHASFGWGGYAHSMIGLSITLGGDAWGIHKGMWGIKHTNHCKWTEDERLKALGEICMYLGDLLTKAKKTSVEQLVGVPVEVITEHGALKSWRVLEEVL